MRCRLFNFAAAVSLVLFLATVVLWVRSYSTTQYVGWASANQFCGVLSMGGLVRLEHATYGDAQNGWSYVQYPSPRGGLWDETRASDRGGGAFRVAGFAWAAIDYNHDGKRIRRALYLPHYAFAALFLTLPLLRLRTRRSRGADICRKCSYNLTGNTSGVCPECGMAIVKVRSGAVRSLAVIFPTVGQRFRSQSVVV